MSRKITLDAADGHRLTAWRSDPAGSAKGGVVVLHAVYGLTAHMGAVCDRWAEAGYAAIAPALFDRVGTDLVHPYTRDGVEAGRKCFAALGEQQILADIAACAAALRSTGPVAISGFCTGGTWAWVAAAKQDFAAQVNFYGSHVPSKLALAPRCPTAMHYGDADHAVKPADVERIRAAYPAVTIHVYRGGKHAFFNPEQESYDPSIASLAWQRSVAFLDRLLTGPARKSA
jgi:carboxymethylenebutenolidase